MACSLLLLELVAIISLPLSFPRLRLSLLISRVSVALRCRLLSLVGLIFVLSLVPISAQYPIPRSSTMANSSRIYVGRISYDVRERDVEKFFKGYGRIREILLKDGFAFVVSCLWVFLFSAELVNVPVSIYLGV